MLRSVSRILDSFDAHAPLAEAKTIEGAFYTDARIADLERRTVFSRSWQVAARADQVDAPGDYVTTEIAGEPIVVVRGDDGVLRAFFNVCRHHAAAVCTDPCGRATRLRCPYHGWTYGLDGHLKTTTELEGIANFDPAANGLVPVAVTTFANLVFVHLDPDPPSIEAFYGARFASEVATLGLGALQHVARREWTIGCNWKVFVDNYLDGGYHVPFLHKGLSSILSFKDYAIDCYDRVCLQSSPIEAGPGAEAMTQSVRKGRALYYWLYPNLMLNWYEGYLDTNLVVPLGIDRMKVVFDFWFADTTEAAREQNARSIAVSERIQDEDHAICESVQRGLGSRAYGAGRLSPRREAGENLFHRLLVEDLRSAQT